MEARPRVNGGLSYVAGFDGRRPDRAPEWQPAAVPLPDVDVAVLGAGPAGLTAAWRAARRGRSVVVLERADAVGGMAASFDVAGIRVDYGSHRLSPDLPPHLLADLTDLLGGDLQKCHRRGRLLLGDRWVAYPFKPRELARALPAAEAARIARQAVGSRSHRTVAAEGEGSYADLMRAGFGTTLYELVYEPYARKLWGRAGEEIDGDQARRKAGSQSAWSALVTSVRHSLTGETLSYWYPRRGFGQLCESIAEAAVTAGAELRLGVAVEGIDAGAAYPTVRLASSGLGGFGQHRGGGFELRAGHVFSTLPLPLLARMTTPAAPAEAVEASGALAFRAVLLVFAVHAGGRWTPFDVHHVPDPRTPVTRISEPANHRASDEDPGHRSVVCFEIPCDVGDEWWNADEQQLAGLLHATVRTCGLPPLRLEWVQAKRLRQAYPIHHVGYREQVAVLQSWVDGMPRLTTLGRAGLFTPDNVHHALTFGYEAADALGPDGFDRRRWHAALAGLADRVVET